MSFKSPARSPTCLAAGLLPCHRGALMAGRATFLQATLTQG